MYTIKMNQGVVVMGLEIGLLNNINKLSGAVNVLIISQCHLSGF